LSGRAILLFRAVGLSGSRVGTSEGQVIDDATLALVGARRTFYGRKFEEAAQFFFAAGRRYAGLDLSGYFQIICNGKVLLVIKFYKVSKDCLQWKVFESCKQNEHNKIGKKLKNNYLRFKVF
jgi:hypothetical protein